MPGPPARIDGILAASASQLDLAAVEAPRLTAETLLCHVLACERSYLYAHPEADVDEDALRRFQQLVERRLNGEPTQYLTGVQEFFSLELEVSPAVFIPRPETELLVEEVIERSRQGARVIDVGAGSGAIPVAVAANRPDLEVFAVERSAAALAVARRNARLHGASVNFLQASLLDAVLTASFDVVVSNPPYVARRTAPTLQREVRFEPELALFGGDDGLEVYRCLIPQALRALKSGGLLVLELGYDSLSGVRELLADAWDEPEVRKDLAGIPRSLSVVKR